MLQQKLSWRQGYALGYLKATTHFYAQGYPQGYA